MKNQKYVFLKPQNNILDLKYVTIDEIALLKSKKDEIRVYLDIIKVDEKIYEEIEKIRKFLIKLKDTDIYIKLNTIKSDVKYTNEEMFLFIENYLKNKLPSLFNLIKNINWKLENNKLDVYINISFGLDNKEKFESTIKYILTEIFAKEYVVELKIKINEEFKIVESLQPKIETYSLDEVEIKELPIKEKERIRRTSNNKSKLKTSDFSVVSSLMIGEKVALIGEIFKIDFREIKTGNIIVQLYITDGYDSIICSKFLNSKEDIIYKLGDFIEVEGIYEKYGIEYSLKANRIEIIDKKKEKRVDDEAKRRIELNVHTNMSEMSSIINAEDLISIAKQFNHEAVAVTDYGVVHNFPFLDKHASNGHRLSLEESFKVIYGIEAYVVDDSISMVYKADSRNIEDVEFVVFDIESTGFSAIEDKIIEIGAVKIKNRRVIETFSEFINPEIEIPRKIQNLTGITNDMVKNSDTIEKVLPRFLEFCKGSVLVAHNAEFDNGFISKKAENIGIEIDFPVIDTLFWAKNIVDDIKTYNLKSLSKRFKVNLENHHRAVDDANATSDIFIKMLEMLDKYEIKTLNDINNKVPLNYSILDTENVVILVKNLKGLKRLYELVSISHLEYLGRGIDLKPKMLKSDLNLDRENFLISSSPVYSGRSNKGKLIKMYLRGFSDKKILKEMEFYDYIQILPHKLYNSSIITEEIPNFEFVKNMNKKFVKFAEKLNKLVVAVGNVFYLEKNEKKMRSAVYLGSDKAHRIYDIDDENYFRNTREMLDEFDYLENREEIVIENTHKIANMIEKIKPIPDGEYRPKIEGSEEIVRNMTMEKAYKLYGNPLPSEVEKRIERELNAIIGNGFSALYLIAHKLVKKSLDNGYIVGSRGSVGSSIVAFLMDITEVNGLYPHYRCPKCKYFEMLDFEGSGVDLEDKICPNCSNELIKDGHSIPFEIFMGFKGDKTPDIDLNFSGEYQSKVHEYTKELFGEKHAFRAGTISTLAEKNALGVVLKYFEEKIKEKIENSNEKYSKEDLDIKIKEELEEYSYRNRAELTRMALKCEGARKTTGQHPGGMIVVPSDMQIYDFTPVQYASNDRESSIITHFDYHVMDTQLVKLDILGHDDPTTLKRLEELTGVDIYSIKLTDEKVLSLFSSTKVLGVSSNEIFSNTGTNGIPEFGTDFVKRMLEETKPKSFAELVRISGLSHGKDVWTNNAQDYVKNGIATLSEIITVRDDIMNHLIDMKLNNTDAFKIMEFVRKGMPSKNKEAWEEYKKLMKSHNIKDWYIESCEKIKYMFPKGHAVAYVMMAVRIAYFKVYYPLAFYCSVLSRRVDKFSYLEMYKSLNELRESYTLKKSMPKLTAVEKGLITTMELVIEMKARGIEFLNVDIYKSDARNFKIENGKIRIPLIAIDKLGDTVADLIVKEREIAPFSSQDNLMKRTKISRTVMEILRENACVSNIEESDQLKLF